MKKYQLKKILDKIKKKKPKILKMSVFQPLISEYIGGKVMTFEYQTFRKQILSLIISKTFNDSSTCIALNDFKIPLWSSQILKTLC